MIREKHELKVEGMESIPETGYGRSGESAKKSHEMIQGFKYLSYEERVIRCGLTTLEKRRSRGDFIEAYKIITGKESIQWERQWRFYIGARGAKPHQTTKNEGFSPPKFQVRT